MAIHSTTYIQYLQCESSMGLNSKHPQDQFEYLHSLNPLIILTSITTQPKPWALHIIVLQLLFPSYNPLFFNKTKKLLK